MWVNLEEFFCGSNITLMWTDIKYWLIDWYAWHCECVLFCVDRYISTFSLILSYVGHKKCWIMSARCSSFTVTQGVCSLCVGYCAMQMFFIRVAVFVVVIFQCSWFHRGPDTYSASGMFYLRQPECTPLMPNSSEAVMCHGSCNTSCLFLHLVPPSLLSAVRKVSYKFSVKSTQFLKSAWFLYSVWKVLSP